MIVLELLSGGLWLGKFLVPSPVTAHAWSVVSTTSFEE